MIPNPLEKPKLYNPTERRPMHWKPSHLLFLEALAGSKDGLTDYELAGKTGKRESNTRGRRGELCKLGLVEDSGTTRSSPAGVKMTVWIVTPLGWAKLYKLGKEIVS